MTDELAQRRAQRELPHALADMLDASRRLADELRRLGEGIEALADEWEQVRGLKFDPRDCAEDLRALLRGKR